MKEKRPTKKRIAGKERLRVGELDKSQRPKPDPGAPSSTSSRPTCGGFARARVSTGRSWLYGLGWMSARSRNPRATQRGNHG